MSVFVLWMVWQEEVMGPERRAAIEAKRSLDAPEQDWATETESRNDEPTNAFEKGEPVLKQGSKASLAKSEVTEANTATPLWSGVLENENVRIELSNRGGIATSWQMKKFFETPRHEVPIELIEVPGNVIGTLGTTFSASGSTDLSQSVYALEKSDADQVIMVLRRGDLEVRKTFSRPDENYEMQMTIEMTNRGSTPLDSSLSMSIPASMNDRVDFKELSLVALVDDEVTRELVPSVGGGSFFGGLFGGDDGPFKAKSDVGWAGIDLRYFAGVILPADPTDVGVNFIPIDQGRVATAQINQSGNRLVPGETLTRRYSVFFGPKDPALLRDLGRELDQTINRGWSWVEPLTVFFEWALESVHRVVPNYGLVIILLTILVRLVTLPIITKQMKSSERMREVMPRIKELQEKYKDDRQKQSEETFKIYKEEGVNPLSGCLPLLLQMPVFIGLFYALQTSFDLRQAPFVFWITDLSAPATLFTLPGVDFPIRVLPLIMAGSMFFQQQMTPQTGMDPAQAKMMMIMMPGIMLLFSYTFPSGLVLYWTVSNLLGIGHQLLIRRQMHAKEQAA